MANVIRDLTKKKELNVVQQEQEVPLEFEQEVPMSEDKSPAKEIAGEVQFDNQEGEILRQVSELKAEREREMKETKAPGAVSDTAAAAKAAGDDSTDDDDNAIPIKYYGYQVSAAVLDYLEEKVKKKQNTTEPWLAIWLMRLLQKVN